jgi:DNA-binding IclR family transcriptional regulator
MHMVVRYVKVSISAAEGEISSAAILRRVPTSRDRKVQTPAGSQTLARGLTALELISEAPGGLTIQELAERLEIHRTVAARLLATLVQFRLIARHDGRFQPAAGLAVLGASFDNNLRELSMPVLRRLADSTRATASLLVAEAEEQVALAVIVPLGVSYHLSFREGSRYPLDRGAAGLALLAAAPPVAGERELVSEARRQGWVLTHGEIEPNAFGLAVPVDRPAPAPATCINLISHRSDLLEEARSSVIDAARELAEILA